MSSGRNRVEIVSASAVGTIAPGTKACLGSALDVTYRLVLSWPTDRASSPGERAIDVSISFDELSIAGHPEILESYRSFCFFEDLPAQCWNYLLVRQVDGSIRGFRKGGRANEPDAMPDIAGYVAANANDENGTNSWIYTPTRGMAASDQLSMAWRVPLLSHPAFFASARPYTVGKRPARTYATINEGQTLRRVAHPKFCALVSPLIPSIDCPDRILLDQAEKLEDVLASLLETLCRGSDTAMHYRCSISLEYCASGGTPELPMIELPILLVPDRMIEAGQDLAADAAALSGAVAQWYFSTNPSFPNAALALDLTIFTAGGEERVPILRLQHVVIDIPSTGIEAWLE